MQRIHVNSSNISSIGYDSDRQVLEIEFHSGGICQYFDVPPSRHDGLMRATSHGQYFDQYIKDIYSYRKVN